MTVCTVRFPGSRADKSSTRTQHRLSGGGGRVGVGVGVGGIGFGGVGIDGGGYDVGGVGVGVVGVGGTTLRTMWSTNCGSYVVWCGQTRVR